MAKSTKVALLVIATLIVAIAVPFCDAVSISPYKGRDITCKANLRQIGNALLSYRTAHQNKMAPGLKSLRPIVESRTVFECPVSGGEAGYTFLFIHEPHGGDIICWDTAPHRPNHSVFVWLNRESRNVLYANGKVGTVPEEQFDRLRLRGVSLTPSQP